MLLSWLPRSILAFVFVTSVVLVGGDLLPGPIPVASAAPVDSDGDGKLEITTCDDLFTELADSSLVYEIFPPAASIDCSSTTQAPISGFTGDLYGNGATISGINILCTTELAVCGLFDWIEESTISDLTFDRPAITSAARAGVLAGRTTTDSAKSPAISNISITGGTVTGGDTVASTVGSIVGWAYVGTFTNVESSAVVSGGEAVGGLFGSLSGNGCSGGSPSVTASSFSGTATGTRRVGGIAGVISLGVAGGCEATLLANTGTITATGSNASCEVGGLFGELSRTVLTASSNSGDVIVPNGATCSDNIGGVVGFVKSSSSASVIDGVWNAGTVGDSGNTTAIVHGLVGLCDQGAITRSYNVGTVHGGSVISSGFATMSASCPSSDSFVKASVTGGAGFAYIPRSIHPRVFSVAAGVPFSKYGWPTATGNCTGSFWNSDIASGTNQSAGALGKTTSELKTTATFTDAGWDFSCISPVWAIDATINDGYPFLVGVGMGAAYTPTTPPVTITRSASGSMANGETDTITFTLCESSTDFAEEDVTVTGGSLSSFTGSGTTYTATFTPDDDSSGTAQISVGATTFTDADGNDNDTSTALSIPFNTVVAPSSLAYSSSNLSLPLGQAMTALTPTVTGTVTAWSVSPALPTGLTISSSTGVISGTPTTATASATYTITATNPAGTDTYDITIEVTSSEATIESQNVFIELTPSRLVDTRSGDRLGALDGSGDPLEVQITGDLVPADALAVALNVTVVDGQANDYGGFVTVYPCGTRPDSSNLNFVSGQTVPNAVIAPLSDDGTVCLYLYGTAHLLVDISGYLTDGFESLRPTRVADTRSSDRVGAIDGSGDPLEVQITGDLVPADANAVALNVTVVDGQANDYGGFVTVYPCGTRPDSSNLNFVSGQTVPNAVIAPLSDDGTVCLYVYGTAHLLVDISGYLTDGFESLRPTRVADTRSSDRVGAIDGSGDPLEVQITGDLVPADANAVALNVTVVDGQANDYGGYVTVYPCGTRPDSSNLNFVSGQTVANAVIAPLSDDGTVCLYVYGTAHLLVDISGYLLRWLNVG